MAAVTPTRTYADGQTISADNYNDDRTEIVAGVNSINNAQIASDAAIDVTKLATTVATTNTTQTFTNKTLTSPTINTPTLVLADTSPTVDGSIGFDRTAEELQIGDGTNSRAIQVGAWTAWSPTLSNITIGNGTVKARYTVIGKTVIISFLLTFGSTTSITGSDVSFTLPVASRIDTHHPVSNCSCMLHDAGSQYYMGWPEVSLSTVTVRAWDVDGTYAERGFISSTAPFTWTVNDQIYVSGSYEAV